jgi:hypothetical protein
LYHGVAGLASSVEQNLRPEALIGLTLNYANVAEPARRGLQVLQDLC